MTERLSNLVVVQARAGLEKSVEIYLSKLTLRCRAEVGCLQYDCFQSLENPGRFMLNIQWQDEPSLALHLGSEPIREFFEKIAVEWLIASPEEDYRRFSRDQK